MRYISIPTITFEDKDGNKFPVKDLREIPLYETAFEIDIVKGDRIDEIASRSNVYEEQSEDLSYLIFEHNIIDIVEARFDLEKLKRIQIPVVNIS